MSNGESRTVEQLRTAGPWRVGDAGRTVFGPPNGNPSPVTVATCLQRANAAYIARACNAHDSLVAALRGLLDAMETPRTVKATAAWDIARAVLAKVAL